MAKNYDGISDAGLNACRNGATRATLCSAQPANYAGIAAVALGAATISSADFTAPADGSPSGRAMTFSGKAGVVPTADGTVNHIAFHNNADIMYAVTTVTSQAVTTSQTWDIPSCTITQVDPT